jgi:predicted ATPase
MSMRLAERTKSYQTLSRRYYRSTLTGATFTTVEQRVQRLSFSPGLSVICGGNGAGKATILAALWRTITSNPDGPPNLPRTPSRLERIEVSGTWEDVKWDTSFSVGEERFEGRCPATGVYLDASFETDAILRRLREDEEPGDLTAGVDPSPLPDEQVQMLSHVLRRNYDEVLVYEVTSFSEDDTPTPFFEVSSHGQRYSLPEMGRGELAACYLIWRICQLEPGSIVLLEEPESHLATYSQGALTDAIVKVVTTRDLTIVASSHSPAIIEKLPSAAITLTAASPTFSIRSSMAKSQISQQLGLRASRSVMAITEDVAAGYFLEALLFLLDRELHAAVEIRAAKDGESGVTRTLSGIRAIASRTRFAVLGVLDGDQRPSNSQDVPTGIGYLPGTTAPEDLLRHAASGWSRRGEYSTWIPRLPGGAEGFAMALEQVDGADHHDWLIELAKVYGDLSQITGTLMELLLQDEHMKAQSMQLLDWIRTQITQ